MFRFFVVLSASLDADRAFSVPGQEMYIASVEVNGKKIDRPFLTWEEITGGGEILFRLREHPESN